MQIADGIAGFKDERPRILMVSSAAVERNAIIGDDLGTHWLHFLSPCICHESVAFSAAPCCVPLLPVQQGACAVSKLLCVGLRTHKCVPASLVTAGISAASACERLAKQHIELSIKCSLSLVFCNMCTLI